MTHFLDRRMISKLEQKKKLKVSVVKRSEVPVLQFAECTGGNTRETRQDSRSPGRDCKNSNIPNRKQLKYQNAQEQLHQLDVPLTTKWVWKVADTRTSTKSLGSPVPVFDLRD